VESRIWDIMFQYTGIQRTKRLMILQDFLNSATPPPNVSPITALNYTVLYKVYILGQALSRNPPPWASSWSLLPHRLSLSLGPWRWLILVFLREKVHADHPLPQTIKRKRASYGHSGYSNTGILYVCCAQTKRDTHIMKGINLIMKWYAG